jgi:hypothetical protein
MLRCNTKVINGCRITKLVDIEHILLLFAWIGASTNYERIRAEDHAVYV